MTILFDERDILAVVKPEGVASIPECAGDAGCVQARAASAVGARLWVVHRLDKDVSGVLLFARTAAAHRFLNAAFAERRIRKTYLAVVIGSVSVDSGRIDSPLREFGSGRTAADSGRGRESVTDYAVVERFEGYTLLALSPLTGRRHQLRAHLYGIGHPIAGDRLYGDRAGQRRFPRLMLHAASVVIPLPGGGAATIEAPPPDSFAAFVAELRARGDGA